MGAHTGVDAEQERFFRQEGEALWAAVLLFPPRLVGWLVFKVIIVAITVVAAPFYAVAWFVRLVPPATFVLVVGLAGCIALGLAAAAISGGSNATKATIATFTSAICFGLLLWDADRMDRPE